MSSLGGFSGMAGSSGSNMGRRLRGENVPSGYRKASLQNYTPEQMQLFQQMFGQVSPDSYTSRLAAGDQDLFNEMEAPALRQFNQLQGGIASRFSGMGMGGRRSSGFQNTMSAEGSNFAQQLQAQRQALQRQAIQDLMGLSSNLLGQRPHSNALVQKRQKGTGWGGVAGAALGGVGGFLAGGPAGAMAGAQLGHGIFSGGDVSGIDMSGYGDIFNTNAG